MTTTERRARLLCLHLLAGQPARVAHSAGVARRVLATCAALHLPSPDLAAAAWLHDIGYSPQLVLTGVHALDGARFVRGAGFTDLVAALVARHSGAEAEARQQGVHSQTRSYPVVAPALMDVIDHADATTSKDGRPIPPSLRFAEAIHRHGDDVSRSGALLLAVPARRAAVERVERLLATAAQRSGSES